MYKFLSTNLRYEKKVKIDKEQLLMRGFSQDLLKDASSGTITDREEPNNE